MLVTDLLSSAFRGVTVNIKRSLLTMLGIIIGVGAVVLMSAIGASMKGVILGQISSLGAKSMIIFAGNEEGNPIATGFDRLTFDDIEALKQLSTIRSVAPVVTLPGKTSYGKEESSPQVLGVTLEFFGNQDIEVQEGRNFDQAEIDGAKYVALLGPDTAQKLFGQADPLGQRIKVGNAHFTVIGITKALGSQFFQNADERVYVPMTVAKQERGHNYVNYITMLATGGFPEAFADVKSLLRQRHRIDNPDDDPKKDDFIIHSSEEAGAILGGVSMGLTLFITTIAAISLLVGGIGIMNIMLVTVSERTQEIGLRKAIGARSRDILRQFLLEAVLLTVIGGFIGIVGGIALAWVIALIITRLLASYTFAIAPVSIVASFIMAAVTGIVFGISPARRAAALSPMEALRYE